MQFYGDRVADFHGIFRHMAIHRQNMHTVGRSFPKRSGEFRIRCVVGMKIAHIRHLDNEQHISPIARTGQFT